MPLFIADLTVTSPDIEPLSRIPERLSADGGNEIPSLAIAGVPDGTVELALVLHDPDAPLAHGFTHWVVYGIPADVDALDLSAAGVRVGPNGLGERAYSGPQPPAGHGEHHYFFTVYALARPVEGEPTREAFLDGYADDIVEQARLVGTFSRD